MWLARSTFSPHIGLKKCIVFFSWLFLAHMIPTGPDANMLALIISPQGNQSILSLQLCCMINYCSFLSLLCFSYVSIILAYKEQIFFFWGSLSFTDQIFSPYFLQHMLTPPASFFPTTEKCLFILFSVLRSKQQKWLADLNQKYFIDFSKLRESSRRIEAIYWEIETKGGHKARLKAKS